MDITDDMRFEEQNKILDEALNELKKHLDLMLGMRLQCSELELDLATLYKPDLKHKIMHCQKTCSDCEGLVLNGMIDERKGDQPCQLPANDGSVAKLLPNMKPSLENKDVK